jgi:hypothetical protein
MKRKTKSAKHALSPLILSGILLSAAFLSCCPRDCTEFQRKGQVVYGKLGVLGNPIFPMINFDWVMTDAPIGKIIEMTPTADFTLVTIAHYRHTDRGDYALVDKEGEAWDFSGFSGRYYLSDSSGSSFYYVFPRSDYQLKYFRRSEGIGWVGILSEETCPIYSKPDKHSDILGTFEGEEGMYGTMFACLDYKSPGTRSISMDRQAIFTRKAPTGTYSTTPLSNPHPISKKQFPEFQRTAPSARPSEKRHFLLINGLINEN